MFISGSVVEARGSFTLRPLFFAEALAFLTQFFTVIDCGLDAFLSFSGSSFMRGTLPTCQLICVLFGKLLERLNLLPRLFQALLQGTLAAE